MDGHPMPRSFHSSLGQSVTRVSQEIHVNLSPIHLMTTRLPSSNPCRTIGQRSWPLELPWTLLVAHLGLNRARASQSWTHPRSPLALTRSHLNVTFGVNTILTQRRRRHCLKKPSWSKSSSSKSVTIALETKMSVFFAAMCLNGPL